MGAAHRGRGSRAAHAAGVRRHAGAASAVRRHGVRTSRTAGPAEKKTKTQKKADRRTRSPRTRSRRPTSRSIRRPIDGASGLAVRRGSSIRRCATATCSVSTSKRSCRRTATRRTAPVAGLDPWEFHRNRFGDQGLPHQAHRVRDRARVHREGADREGHRAGITPKSQWKDVNVNLTLRQERADPDRQVQDAVRPRPAHRRHAQRLRLPLARRELPGAGARHRRAWCTAASSSTG